MEAKRRLKIQIMQGLQLVSRLFPKNNKKLLFKGFKFKEQDTTIVVELLNGHLGCNWKNAMCRMPFETRGNVSRPFRKLF